MESTTATKGALFVKEVIARLKGDNAEALGAKIARKAISSVEGQLAALKAKQVDLEDTVEDAQEALKVAKFPTEMIINNQCYINDIRVKFDDLETAKNNLKDVVESIAFFEGLLNEF